MKRVLLVDDDNVVLLHTGVRLKSMGYTVYTAKDAINAVAAVRKNDPDVVVLDISLPAGDGFAVLKQVKQFPALSRVPVIVLTGRDPGGNERRSLESGAVAFFQKPADEAELMEVIRTNLRPAWGWGPSPS